MDDNTKGLLYPAYHKFYSALNSLDKFEKGANFFDNIAYLDNFFSEYRNITFVLQKSLAHTKFKDQYETIRDKHLKNDVCKWFMDKRNEVLKQQPFDLEKKINITIYSDHENLSYPSYIFNIENDQEYVSVIDSLREKFLSLGRYEVMFSAEFSFNERGRDDDLYENFIDGIRFMKEFMREMSQVVNEDCRLSDNLIAKIKKFIFYRIPKNMLLIDDYLYYCYIDSFEKSSRMEIIEQSIGQRYPISNLHNVYGRENSNIFEIFLMMHITTLQMGGDLLPTIMLLYNDNTFSLQSFDGSHKTTCYRKLNEASLNIQQGQIEQFYFVTELTKIVITDSIGSKLFAFFMLGTDEYEDLIFDQHKLQDPIYIASVLEFERNVTVVAPFVRVIENAFKMLAQKK